MSLYHGCFILVPEVNEICSFPGAISRADLRHVIAARFYGEQLALARSLQPVFRPCDRDLVPAWDQALDAIGPAIRRCIWRGSHRSSTPGVCSPELATRGGRSATSPNA